MLCRRPLDSNEQLLFLCDRVSPFHVILILTIRGQFSAENCPRAITELQKLHPLLQVKVGRLSWTSSEFIRDSSLEIPFVSFSDDMDSIGAHIETELRSRIDTQAGPLMRIKHIQHDDEVSTFIFTTHHSASDGLSSTILAKDFLTLLSSTNGCSEKGGAALPAPIGVLLSADLRGLRGFIRHARELIRTGMSAYKQGAPAKLSLRDADLTTRTSIIAPRTVDVSQVEKILSCCKAHGCSMHGALGAALLLSLKDNVAARLVNNCSSKDDIDLRNIENGLVPTIQLLSPVNIRSKLAPPVVDEYGLFVATQATNHRLTNNKTFWELALEISVELRRNVDIDAPMAFMPIASKYLTKAMAIGNAISGGTRFSQWVCSTFPPCVALSNLGAINIPRNYGNIRLEDMSFLGSLSAMGAISSFAMTLYGKLSWNFVAMAPSLDRAHLETVADDSIRYLLENIF